MFDATTWVTQYFMIGVMVLGLVMMYRLSQRWAKRVDERLDKAAHERVLAHEKVDAMLDEHRRCSAMMVAALSNPRAKVTVVMRCEPLFHGTNTAQPQKDLS